MHSCYKWGWRTKAQIIADHGGDTDAADSIIKKKIAAGLVQDHPDDDDLKTYYVPFLHHQHTLFPIHSCPQG